MLHHRLKLALLIVGSAIMGGALVWVGTEAGNIYNDPSRTSVRSQMMRRKQETMHHILDDMVRGDLRGASASAKDMRAYADTLERFLDTREYSKHNDEYRQSIEDLIEAGSQDKADLARNAALRLERTCLECHALLR